MSWEPVHFLDGMDAEETDAARDLNDRCEIADAERAYPASKADGGRACGEQLTVAFDHLTGEPHQLPAGPALLNGVTVEGRSGTRKSVTLQHLVAQVIALGLAAKVVVISFKESMETFANGAIEAARAGVRFRYLNTTPGRPSYGVPLLHTLAQRVPDALELADYVLRAMALFYGHDYGRSHFYEVARKVLAYAFACTPPPGGAWTFADLARAVAALDPPAWLRADFEKGRAELVNLLFLLGSCDAINCRPGDDRALVDLGGFFASDRPEVLDVQAAVEQKRSVSFLLPQFLFALAALVLSARPETDRLRVLFVIDEAGEAFTDLLARVIQRLRSRGCGFVFAYQHAGQFVQGRRDFRADFEGYASTKLYLSLEDAQRLEFYRLFAGEELRVTDVSTRVGHDPDPTGGDLGPQLYLPDEHYSTRMVDGVEKLDRHGETRTVTYGPRPRLSVNDGLHLFSQEGYGLVRSSTDRGWWRQSGMLIPVHFPFFITQRERDRRRGLPWPAAAGTRPVVYTDEFARYLAEAQKPAPTIAQGGGWGKLFDKDKRRKPR